ncbi:hypothetical protein MMC32_000801 [Xylographa parallela]|nr:hypothetical protein [Xylographa parallela]
MDSSDDESDNSFGEGQDLEGYIRELAAGEDVVEIFEELLEMVTETWALYSVDEGDYDGLKDSVERLIRSEPCSVHKLLAATYINKYLEWLWHPSNRIPGNQDALRVYESHLATLYQLGYEHTEACAHIADVNHVPLTLEQEPYREHFVW